MSETSQDVAAAETYLDDWSTHLSKLPTANITISSATVTTTGGSISGAAPSSDGKGVVFKLNAAGATASTDITVTVSPTLSNGDTPVRHHTIGITND